MVRMAQKLSKLRSLQRRSKENSTCLVAYATNESDIYKISATDATMKWKLSRTEFGYAVIIISSSRICLLIIIISHRRHIITYQQRSHTLPMNFGQTTNLRS